MPVRMRKIRGGKYRVTDAGKTTAKGTTKSKAKKQADLLRAVAHGWKPTRKRLAAQLGQHVAYEPPVQLGHR